MKAFIGSTLRNGKNFNCRKWKKDEERAVFAILPNSLRLPKSMTQ